MAKHTEIAKRIERLEVKQEAALEELVKVSNDLRRARSSLRRSLSASTRPPPPRRVASRAEVAAQVDAIVAEDRAAERREKRESIAEMKARDRVSKTAQLQRAREKAGLDKKPRRRAA